MKKLLFTAVSALAIAGAAVAVDSTQFGVLPVVSSASNTVVSVPWLESGTGSDNVKVADLVLTAGLSNGDELRLYDGSSYSQFWRLENNQWVAGTKVGDGGTEPSGNDQTTIARGKALMLIRTNPGNVFYIMGKPAALTDAEKTLALASGTKDAPAYSLIAPPTVDDVDANDTSKFTWTNMKAGKDHLYIGSLSTGSAIKDYVWSGKRWKDADGNTVVPIKSGTGFWFKSTDNTTGSKQVQWNL